MCRLLQIGPLPDRLQTLLAQRYEVYPYWNDPNPEYLLERVHFDGAVTMSRHGCNAKHMRALAGKVVACFGVGTEHIDLAAAQEMGVSICNTPDVLTDCVADLAWGLLLATARKIPQAHLFVREGGWGSGSFGLGSRVYGKKIGIVGLGRIGRAIWKRSLGFDMEMRYYGRFPKHDVPGFEPDLVALADWSDFLVLACQGGPETYHLVDEKVIEAIGKQGILINVSRGSVVDETALIDALQQGRLGGAGLDVLSNEPHVPSGLMDHPSVILLPHIGASTQETRQAMEDLVIENLDRYFRFGEVLTPVSREARKG